jgi:hypothetical protein
VGFEERRRLQKWFCCARASEEIRKLTGGELDRKPADKCRRRRPIINILHDALR